MIRRHALSTAAVLAVLALGIAAAAQAIGNGVPDGSRHPNVGMLAIELDGVKYGQCSGSYAGARKGAPSEGVFLTAGHCVAWLPDAGIDAGQLWVTFDSTATWDAETGEVVGATTWYRGSAYGFDPATGADRSNLKDWGVVVIATTVPVPPVELPTAGQLDRMAAHGGLRPMSVLDNVGYGVVPAFTHGPPRGGPPPGRMVSTSTFQSLTPAYLNLLMTAETRDGENGGVCFGDSGAPHFVHGSNVVVGVTSGGDAICRATNRNQRLDVPDARAFLGRYLDLP